MLGGLGLGLIVALATYVQGQSGTARISATPEPVAANTPEPVVVNTPAPEEPAPAPAAEPADPPASRFDFYELLPRFEVVIPEVETEARADNSTSAVEQPGAYVVQAGSFTTLADADSRQASLAMLGIESRIQRVTIDDDVYHRVRVGPISELTELNRTRRRLREARIETLLMKVPQ